MVELPYEIIIYIQNLLIKNSELRAYYNLCKAFNWDIDIKYFECELRNSRQHYTRDYDNKMIELWKKTGIDDGLPIEYLEKHLNYKTRLFKTMWALYFCSGRFYDMIEWFERENTLIKYTENILSDNRSYNKYYKYKKQRTNGPCQKCWRKYKKELYESKMNETQLTYKYLQVHEYNK